MTAPWAAIVVSVVIALAASAVYMLREGRREGKLDACLEQLTRIAADHEARLRALEKP